MTRISSDLACTIPRKKLRTESRHSTPQAAEDSTVSQDISLSQKAIPMTIHPTFPGITQALGQVMRLEPLLLRTSDVSFPFLLPQYSHQ